MVAAGYDSCSNLLRNSESVMDKSESIIESDNLPYPDDDDDTIDPDIASKDQQPLSPGRAVRLEQEKYGETSLDANRDDQLDEHHADVDDIV
jgi:hypothetical protein